MLTSIFSLGIHSEEDLVTVRQRSRQISALLNVGTQDQVRIATAVSELTRHVLSYALSGKVEFSVDHGTAQPTLCIHIKSTANAERSHTPTSADQRHSAGLDSAIVSAHRLMDSCTTYMEAGASVMSLRKKLTDNTMATPERLAAIVRQIGERSVSNSYTEIQLQNKELLDTLAELRIKQDDLLALTQELEDTNRGVVALYAEIEEKAERLRQADETKSRFLSNTSHELRTPLSSIRALSQILLDRIDGELTSEQEKQIRFIADAATDLSDLVNDLLDLAKIESGKIGIYCTTFSIRELFRTLKGMLRPLSTVSSVALLFEDPVEDLKLYSDEGKVSQIVRNFVSNALKFTTMGSVRVWAACDADTQCLRIGVTDTGIGIARENLQFVFEEFSQIESPLQQRIKGTGLGLPLCRILAKALGGHVELDSTVDIGSTFSLVLPMRFTAPDHVGDQNLHRIAQ